MHPWDLTRCWLDCRASTVMALFCIRPVDSLSTDSNRAELLRWLIDSHHAIDLSAVNARLQMPVHCALETHSMEVLEVRLRGRLATAAPLENSAQQTPSVAVVRKPSRTTTCCLV